MSLKDLSSNEIIMRTEKATACGNCSTPDGFQELASLTEEVLDLPRGDDSLREPLVYMAERLARNPYYVSLSAATFLSAALRFGITLDPVKGTVLNDFGQKAFDNILKNIKKLSPLESATFAEVFEMCRYKPVTGLENLLEAAFAMPPLDSIKTCLYIANTLKKDPDNQGLKQQSLSFALHNIEGLPEGSDFTGLYQRTCEAIKWNASEETQLKCLDGILQHEAEVDISRRYEANEFVLMRVVASDSQKACAARNIWRDAPNLSTPKQRVRAYIYCVMDLENAEEKESALSKAAEEFPSLSREERDSYKDFFTHFATDEMYSPHLREMAQAVREKEAKFATESSSMDVQEVRPEFGAKPTNAPTQCKR